MLINFINAYKCSNNPIFPPVHINYYRIHIFGEQEKMKNTTARHTDSYNGMILLFFFIDIPVAFPTMVVANIQPDQSHRE